jgi:hypothetical protein
MKRIIILGFIIFGVSKFWPFIVNDMLASPKPVSSTETSKNNNKYKVKLVLEDTQCKRDGDYVYMTGFVQNNDDYSYSFIEVKGLLSDSKGSVLNTESVYAVDSEGLGPKERKKFDIMLDYVGGGVNCNYSIIDYQ